MQFFIKTVISAIIIAIVSTLSKKSPTFGAVIVSLPLTSMLAIIWLYRDTHDVQKIIDLSSSILWIIIPSLIFFIALIFLLKRDVRFELAMIFSSIIMILSYNLYIIILRKFGINI